MYLWVLSHTEMFTKEVLVSLQLLTLYCDLFYVFVNKNKPSSFKLTDLCVNGIWNPSVFQAPHLKCQQGYTAAIWPACLLQAWAREVCRFCGICTFKMWHQLLWKSGHAGFRFCCFCFTCPKPLLRLLGKSGVFFIQSEQPAVHSSVRLKQRHKTPGECWLQSC